ncbi:short-chain dehydrogenase [Colletotrichum scovillei]|uniref:Short-chain dehydrogenase n=1 Tax=Colletotrichum scovillei TaxID=1209932 RepID=A0A9P7RF07_9PEZI|nr:short-chain dehydrogenase [Colletotrichum scovillei]KAF4773475.1 short-chain dehydrogenase [Colletotrichum scovillei]KAG7056106.1 short-chain dehydrogenase [Colletotrichum scovillei]KAG7075550.1 short-chain dehydrogenase [Colletotrichum scovillei]KAG7082599.1 short-chain dehydrogenase [Colletotrichum scovillei]
MDSTAIFRVDGIVAVITGGGTGIGLTMARALVSQGAAKVYILGRRLEMLEAAAKEHPNLIPHKCDVTSKEDLQSIVDRITKEVGYVNLVIANSGVLGPSVRFNPAHSISDLKKILFDDFSMTEMTEVLHVNITAAFFTMSAFLELLDAGNKNALKGGFGKPDREGSDVIAIQSQVIFTSSISAFSRHFSSTPPYLASKTAIMQLTKQASSQLARHGIRVNGIAPGLFPSEIAAGLIGDRKPDCESPDDTKFIPARRFGGDEEMTGAILYLTSRSGSYSNGSIMVMDGGRLSAMASSY